MKVFITGGMGFIGSHLTDHLLREGHQVTVCDDLSAGTFYETAARFYHADISKASIDRLAALMKGHYVVVHLASNAVIRGGFRRSAISANLKVNVSGTRRVLEAMRVAGVRNLVFASTGAVYGDADQIPTPETYGPLKPVSPYGATKLAAEGLIAACCHGFGLNAAILRMNNIIGARQSRGIVVDFVKKALASENPLPVLGDGRQRKQFCHVSDCVEAITFFLKNLPRGCEIYNLAGKGTLTADDVARIVQTALGIRPVCVQHTGGDRGWRGDAPITVLDTTKLQRRGWAPTMDSREAVRRAATALALGPKGGDS